MLTRLFVCLALVLLALSPVVAQEKLADPSQAALLQEMSVRLAAQQKTLEAQQKELATLRAQAQATPENAATARKTARQTLERTCTDIGLTLDRVEVTRAAQSTFVVVCGK